MSKPVQLRYEAGIATLQLTDPARGNALGPELTDALGAAVDAVAERDDVRVLRVTGTGPTFCVGGDIRNMHAHADQLSAMLGPGLDALNALIRSIAELPMPVVTTINGSLGGGGVGLALAADLVVASRSAKLRGGYSAIGLVPDVGTSYFLARRVGAARAKRLLFLNEALDSSTCLDWGLYDFVYDDASFEDQSHALLETLARSATQALTRTKQLIDAAHGATLTQQLASEKAGMLAAAEGNEFREGFAAFLEKRTPQFGG